MFPKGTKVRRLWVLWKFVGLCALIGQSFHNWLNWVCLLALFLGFCLFPFSHPLHNATPFYGLDLVGFREIRFNLPYLPSYFFTSGLSLPGLCKILLLAFFWGNIRKRRLCLSFNCCLFCLSCLIIPHFLNNFF